MKNLILIIAAILTISSCRVSKKQSSPFTFLENDQGVELRENGQKVFFYQKTPVTSGPEQFNHYLHPVYKLSGQVITRAYPKEEIDWHYNHRGIFWGWRQVYINKDTIGDAWVMNHIRLNMEQMKTVLEKNKAELILKVKWFTTRQDQKKAFMEENTEIKVYPVKDHIRAIDFRIGFKALIPGVYIAGSDNFKGYGGFSTRIKLKDSLNFLTQKGLIEPQTAPLDAGPWVDFSTPTLSAPDKFGFTILCHPSIPNFPSPWLLRRKGSMQNPAFPGRKKLNIPTDKEIILRYRIIIHDGNAKIDEINKWYDNYTRTVKQN